MEKVDNLFEFYTNEVGKIGLSLNITKSTDVSNK
jgi:hypothetical protein